MPLILWVSVGVLPLVAPSAPSDVLAVPTGLLVETASLKNTMCLQMALLHSSQMQY